MRRHAGPGGVRLSGRHARPDRGRHEEAGVAAPRRAERRRCAALDRGGIEVLDADLAALPRRRSRARTTRSSARSPIRASSRGIGNAYSDEILHRARLSPLKLTRRMSDEEIARLHDAVARGPRRVGRAALATKPASAFPEKVTAFRDGMAVHGRYGKPCPVCGVAGAAHRLRRERVELLRDAARPAGKLLADRALSQLLRGDWPQHARGARGTQEAHRLKRRADGRPLGRCAPGELPGAAPRGLARRGTSAGVGSHGGIRNSGGPRPRGLRRAPGRAFALGRLPTLLPPRVAGLGDLRAIRLARRLFRGPPARRATRHAPSRPLRCLTLALGLGFGWTDLVDEIPEINRRFNFRIEGAAGVRRQVTETSGWTFEVRYQHTSNAGTVPPNLRPELVRLSRWLALPVRF